jgi:ADP-L-glycero-D-manno-heptose 6-epimerase
MKSNKQNETIKNPLPLNAGAIVITGAAGFIGSCMVQYLNEQGFDNLILVDRFSKKEKERNWKNKKFQFLIEREDLLDSLVTQRLQISFFIHLGARTDTTEFNYSVHQELNVEYSQDVWNYCTINNIPLIYASSAATYGAGDLGYDDDHELSKRLKPLNAYGISKNEFDKWALQQENGPPFWAGLKFFNVYGPNEYHKGRMASVIFHSFNQIQKDGVVKLFKSHKEDFKDGEQLRDFIYVKDVVKVVYWIMKEYLKGETAIAGGLYNLGTGKARSFIDLVTATFNGLDKEPNIAFIEMPEDIRNKYQYFTEANMYKLKHEGYHEPFYSLEEGVNDYVRGYLSSGKIW